MNEILLLIGSLLVGLTLRGLHWFVTFLVRSRFTRILGLAAAASTPSSMRSHLAEVVAFLEKWGLASLPQEPTGPNVADLLYVMSVLEDLECYRPSWSDATIDEQRQFAELRAHLQAALQLPLRAWFFRRLPTVYAHWLGLVLTSGLVAALILWWLYSYLSFVFLLFTRR